MLGMLDDVHLIDLNSLEGTEADWLIDSKVRRHIVWINGIFCKQGLFTNISFVMPIHCME